MEKTVADVKSYVDIVDLVSSSGVRLIRVGRVLQGLCPFHAERTPSFTVYPDTQSFYCFGCGEGGDVIDFVRLRENVGFMDAIERLSRDIYSASSRPPQLPPPPPVKQALPKELIGLYTDVYKTAREAILTDIGKDAEHVRQYMASRGFSRADIERIHVGAYLPAHRDRLKDHYPKETIDISGLMSYGKGYNYQLIFPHFNTNGEIIGLVFRLTKDGTDSAGRPLSKYKFTPQFDKDVPYNLYHAAGQIKANNGNVIVVEGHLDINTLVALGFANAVCLGGHYLNKRHIDMLIAAGAKNILLWMDSDDAGTKGAVEGVKLVLQDGRLNIFTITTSYKDVGDINKIQKREDRIDAIRKALASNVFGSTWLGRITATAKWDKEAQAYMQITSATDRQETINTAKEIYNSIVDPVYKREYLKAFCRTAGYRFGDMEASFRQRRVRQPKSVHVSLHLLTRLREMYANENFDLARAQRYVAQMYADCAKNKRLTRESREVFSTVQTMLTNYRIIELYQYVEQQLAELASTYPQSISITAVNKKEG